MEKFTSKELIGLTLDFWKYQLNNNLCTMSQLDSVSDTMIRNIDASGTVEDFAKFCGVPEQYVRNLIHAKVPDKPRRRVYYHFFPFIKNIPKSWLKKR